MAEVVLESRERVLAGILFTAAAYFLFSAQDASIKLLVAGMTVWQIMFVRSITVLLACGAIGGKRLFADTIDSPIVRPMLVRSAFTLAAWLCYYNAARSLQLAELTTIYYAAPIIVTVLSVLILGESVPLLRWIAVLIGFVGVFIACDPTRLGLSVPVLLVLAAAVLWGIAVVLLRKTALQERTTIQLVLNNFYFLLFSAVPALLWWRMPDLRQLLLLLSVGALGGVAQYVLFEGMKRAPVSIVAPFEIHLAGLGLCAGLRHLGRRAAHGGVHGRGADHRRRPAHRRQRAFPQAEAGLMTEGCQEQPGRLAP